MAKLHTVTVDGRTFEARSGERVLDAAIQSGFDLPHDCRAGRCGTCVVRVHSGIVLGGETAQPDMIHACQAMVFSNLTLGIEPVPAVGSVSGKLVRLRKIAEDIVEVSIGLSQPMAILPGQYCKFQFRGYPERSFSPTAPLIGSVGQDRIVLQIKRVQDGRLTPQLGRTVRLGHAVRVTGPFGSAFLRPGQPHRLVLLGSGTGFAPIWSVATAALWEAPGRPMVLLAASRRLDGFYMGPALEVLSRYENKTVTGCVEELDAARGAILPGRAVQYFPMLCAEDIVYAAGAPGFVDAARVAAEHAGASFHADPFSPASGSRPSWRDRAKEWLRAS